MAKSPTQFVSGEVRMSYVHAFKPYAANGGDPKFSVTVLLPKNDVAAKNRLDAAVQAAIQSGVAGKWNGVRPPQLAIPVYDGDGVRPSDGQPFGPECKGHWVFTASAKADYPPQVVDAQLNPIINQSEVYSGMYGRVSVNFFAYNSNGRRGVGCGLSNIQKLRDGEPLGSRTNAADDFSDGAAQTYPQPQQPAYGQPAYQPPQQPAYGQPAATAYQPPQPAYPQPQQPAYGAPAQPQIDPITGQPIGGVMGIG